MNRDIIHTNSTCRVELFHYVNREIIEDVDARSVSDHQKIMKVKRETIIDPIVECSMSKNIANVRGTFDLLFMPTMNWKKKIRPGDWLVIYLGRDGNEVPRMLGNVDRVSRIVIVNEKGFKTIRYKISGSNFGKAFDKYTVFWSSYMPETIAEQVFVLSDSLRFLGSPDKVVRGLLEVFLGRSSDRRYAPLNQWFIPNELTEIFTAPIGVNDLGAKFFDILNINFKIVEGYKIWSNMEALSGSLWDMMKRSSNNMINELFLELEETDTGLIRPTINLRMIPFASKEYSFGDYIDKSQATRFMDLDEIVIPTVEILNEDLGENDHTRFNYFLLTSQATHVSGQALTQGIIFNDPKTNTRYPRLIKGSIKQHGLTIKQNETDYAFLTGIAKKGTDLNVLRAWNNLLFHWYKEDFKYETGTISVAGNPEIKLGRRLVVEDFVTTGDLRHYYIEGYTDNWKFPDRWTTSLQVTRGQDDYERPLSEIGIEDTDQIGITSVTEGFHKRRKKEVK